MYKKIAQLTRTLLAFCAASVVGNVFGVTSAPTVSSSWSFSGSYTVSYIDYNCSWQSAVCFSQALEEKLEPSGAWTPVTGGTRTYTNFSNKPAGRYSYRVVRLLKPYYAQDASAAVTVDVGARPDPPAEDQGYAARHGDLDGDGDIDIYVKRVAGTSWRLPLQEFVLRRNSSGFAVETSVSAATRTTVAQWTASVITPKLVDFNADGYEDLLLNGLVQANAAPVDIVAFVHDGPGAPVPSVRWMDENIKKFALDTVGYLRNPSYFSSAYEIRCVLVYSVVPGQHRDIDANWYYFSLPIVYPSCGVYSSFSYSSTAINAGAYLKSILNSGRYIEGSTEANTVKAQLGQLFGTNYGTSTSLLPADVYLDPGVSIEAARAWRVNVGLNQLFLWAFGVAGAPSPQPPIGPHSYGPIETSICHTSNPRCTRDRVFRKILQFPVTGRAISPSVGCTSAEPRSICGTEIRDNDRTFVEVDELATTDDDVGPVTHTVDETNYTLVNTTDPGHLFYPGSVTRSVVVGADGYVKIVTTGTGSGPYPEMNEVAGPGTFKWIDWRIKDRMDYELSQP